jgi:hypothetical protein
MTELLEISIVKLLCRTLIPMAMEGSSAWTVDEQKEINAAANMTLPVTFLIYQLPYAGF